MAYKKRFELPDKEKIRRLAQFRNMTNDEFDDYWAKKISDTLPSLQLEKRIDLKLDEFDRDYDLSDLKVNDKLTLRALIQAMLQLEDMEQALFKVREEGIGPETVALIRDINNVMSLLRKDISSMQEDLRITRKLRKGDKEQTVISYIEDLKTKARQFYENTMFYVVCDKCGMLLSTTWFLYPDGKNKLVLTCNRTLDTGEKCGNVITVTSKDLLEKRGVNKPDIMPESMF